MPTHADKLKIKASLSNWPGLCLGVFIVLLISACQADTAPNGLSSPTVAVSKPFLKPNSRSEWRSLLAWNDDCEQSFTSTQAGSYSGIETHSLADDDDELVIVMCAVSSYQPSFLLYRLKQHVPKALALETYVESDGQNLQRVEEKELWGEPLFNANTKELIIFNAARQTKDCGTWAKYSFMLDIAKLQEFRAKLPCPQEMKEPVSPDPTRPPEGWKLINNV
jgi:hypothetical protein